MGEGCKNIESIFLKMLESKDKVIFQQRQIIENLISDNIDFVDKLEGKTE